jgi:starch synthase
MRILLASSEVHPYSKTGGLADMVVALAKTLGRLGHQVGVVTPLYRGILERFPGIKKFDWWIDLPLGPYRVSAEVWTDQPSAGLTIYFIRQDGFYDRPGLYSEGGHDYLDNSQRFIFLSKCVAQLARYLPWQPQIVHVHDWQTGLVPALILHQRASEGWWNAPRTCLTIHNLAYQGRFARSEFDYANLPLDYFNPNGVEFYGALNCLKAGISYADIVTAVSPRYAREITTPVFGELLDGALRLRQQSGTLVGILNGVDYDEWNTTNNPFLKHPYSSKDLAGKLANKIALQTEMGLPANPQAPLFATVSRLAWQKGMDIELGALEEMLAADMQFVLLGSGEGQFQSAFHSLARRYPKKVAVRIGFDVALSHRIEAGADFFLMPSRYEPSGLNQMYSLRYGTVPIVRRTGGLDDSVIDITDDRKLANGIKFEEYSVRAVAKAIRKALVLYGEPKLLHLYRQNGMNTDCSWERTAEEYLKLYRGLTGEAVK